MGRRSDFAVDCGAATTPASLLQCVVCLLGLFPGNRMLEWNLLFCSCMMVNDVTTLRERTQRAANLSLEIS